MVNQDWLVSAHFTLASLIKSNTAERMNIDNTPTEEALYSLTDLAVCILEPIWEEFGKFMPSSCYRCPKLNKELGSSKRSQHVKGEAADLEVINVSNVTLFNWIKNNLHFDQLIYEYPIEDSPQSGWLHVSKKAKNNRGETLIATKRDGKTVYLNVEGDL